MATTNFIQGPRAKPILLCVFNNLCSLYIWNSNFKVEIRCADIDAWPAEHTSELFREEDLVKFEIRGPRSKVGPCGQWLLANFQVVEVEPELVIDGWCGKVIFILSQLLVSLFCMLHTVCTLSALWIFAVSTLQGRMIRSVILFCKVRHRAIKQKHQLKRDQTKTRRDSEWFWCRTTCCLYPKICFYSVKLERVPCLVT